MKILRHERLQVGDVILTTTNAPESAAIRTFTKSDISHAMLYVNTCSVIDATEEGVHARNTQRILVDDNRAVHVLRLKEKPDAAKMRAICEYVQQRVGTEYSVREAVQTALGGSDVWSKKQFCSRLVAQAYAASGYHVVADPNYCSPNDLLKSHELEEVLDCTRVATETDIAFAQTTDLSQAMRDSTATWLKEARVKNPTIQSLNDINEHLQRTPDDDEFIHEALRRSGYLTVWKGDVDRSPWHYDLGLMTGIADTEGVRAYCRMTVDDVGAALERHVVNANAYRSMLAEHPLKTFEELAALYDHLMQLHATRLKVAGKWLAEHDPGAPQPLLLVPHSDAWFARLERLDPVKAAVTRAVIAAAGTADVCSVCGDDPSMPYKLDGSHLPGETVPTFRLCDDCLEIRAGMGEKFVPYTDVA